MKSNKDKIAETTTNQPPVASPPPPKKNKVIDRTIWTFVIIFSWCIFLRLGHSYIAILIFVLNILAFNEFFKLKLQTRQEKSHNIGWRKYLYIYYFIISLFRITLYSLSRQINSFIVLHNHSLLKEIVRRENIIFFSFWIIGFLVFVLTLKKKHYLYQFGLFAWTHLFIIMYTLQKSLTMTNLFDGLVWVLLPTTLVVANDIFAYVIGKNFGKTKLIELSPNKTVEGFVGGAVFTFIFAILIGLASTNTSNYLHFLCPQDMIEFSLNHTVTCDPSYMFIPRPMYFLGVSYFTGKLWISEFQIHSVILALFASLIAPFGGFFASGLKRALKVKDFSTIIPGHGGILDRFDCQLLMSTFTFLYLREIVKGGMNSLTAVETYMNGLDLDDQLKLYQTLKNNLQLHNYWGN